MEYLKTCYKNSPDDKLPNLQNAYKPEIDTELTKHIESLLATAMLLGMEHAMGGLKLSDEEIPALPFEEAVAFMKGRIPMTKQEWNALEPKLRFRAFTVGRLAQCDYIESVRGVLNNAINDGQGFASAWNNIKAIAESDGAFQWSPRYWENVFRTNTQTAYVAGKLMQHEKNPPPAWRLMIIDDSRTSDICRGFVKDGGDSLVLPSDHPFWSKYGFPPYHFQCRTGLQAVYSSQIGDDVQVENPSMDSLGNSFKPQEGFGGNPIEKESWWMMTESMTKRAAQYGIFNDVEDLAKMNGLYNFSMNLVRGSAMESLIGTNYSAKKAAHAKPLQKELAAAKILEENDHKVYFTAENISTKNYDAIIDGKLGEFKKPESFKNIVSHLNKADSQRASIVCITPPMENHTQADAVRIINNWFKASQRPIEYVNTVLLIWDGQVITIKK